MVPPPTPPREQPSVPGPLPTLKPDVLPQGISHHPPPLPPSRYAASDPLADPGLAGHAWLPGVKHPLLPRSYGPPGPLPMMRTPLPPGPTPTLLAYEHA